MLVARVRIRLSGTFLKPGKLPGLITRPAAGSTGPGSPMPRARTRRGGVPSSSSPCFTASTIRLMTLSRLRIVPLSPARPGQRPQGRRSQQRADEERDGGAAKDQVVFVEDGSLDLERVDGELGREVRVQARERRQQVCG